MNDEICNFCGADMSGRAEGEGCSKCGNYDEIWENSYWDKGTGEFIEK